MTYVLIYCNFGVGVLLLNNLMTIGGWGQSNRHVTDSWEDATMMIVEHFIKKKGYTEVLVWGSYWMTGDLIWNDGKLLHKFSNF